MVSMDQFWTRVALPFFLFTMGFGLYVLFRIGATQTASTSTVLSTIAALRTRPVFVRDRTAAAPGAAAANALAK